MSIDFNTINNTVNATATDTRGSNTLGKDEFLKLLIVQMQNQDPLEPQNDTEFIAQLAQFSSLEQIQNMNNTMSLNTAIGLIGACVQWTDSDGNLNIGVVTSAKSNNGKAQVMVGDVAVDLEKVKVVTNDGTPLSAAASLIGAEVTWLGADGESYTGVVDSVKVINNFPVLVVGDRLVDYNSVVNVQTPNTSEEVSEEMARALEMIGSHITWEGENNNQSYSGLVYGVQSVDGVPYLVISEGDGYNYISMDSVTSVNSTASEIKDALRLIGSNITWDNGQYTGYVNSVKVIDNVPYVLVGPNNDPVEFSRVSTL